MSDDRRFRLVSIGAQANGWVAIGMDATGFVAVGVVARGVFAFGVASFGVVTVGFLGAAFLACAAFIGVAPLSIGMMTYSIVPWTPPADLPTMTHPLLGLLYWFTYVVGAVASDFPKVAQPEEPLPAGWERAKGRRGRVHMDDGRVLGAASAVPNGPLLVRLERAVPDETAGYREAAPAEWVVAEARPFVVPAFWRDPSRARVGLAWALLAYAGLTLLCAIVGGLVRVVTS